MVVCGAAQEVGAPHLEYMGIGKTRRGAGGGAGDFLLGKTGTGSWEITYTILQVTAIFALKMVC